MQCITKFCIFPIWTQSTSDGGKGTIQIILHTMTCTNVGAVCIKSMEIIYVSAGGDSVTTHVTLHQHENPIANINGEDIDDLKVTPFHNEYIYVKQVTSLFIVARGFGFKILFAVSGRIYCVFDPFYMNKVRFVYVPCYFSM